MAIKYDKGIRGFLGRVPAINYQYTPMPFNEMLAMGQLADRKAQQNLQLQSSINQLYNQPLLDKDREVYDSKFNMFRENVANMVNESGGNLSSGNMTRELTKTYYDIINDRGYINAVNAYQQHQKLQTKIMNSVADMDLRGLYLKRSLEGYEAQPQGSLYNPIMNFSTMSETQFDSNLSTVANQMKARRVKELQQQGDYQYTTETVQLDPEDVAKALSNHVGANSNLLTYVADKAEALGIDAEQFLNNKILNIANRRLQDDFLMSTLKKVPGSEEKNLGLDFEGISVKSGIGELLKGAGDAGNTLKGLYDGYRSGSLGYEDFTSQISLYMQLAKQQGMDMDAIEYMITGETNNIREDIAKLKDPNNIVERDGVFTSQGLLFNGERVNFQADNIEDLYNAIDNEFLEPVERTTSGYATSGTPGDGFKVKEKYAITPMEQSQIVMPSEVLRNAAENYMNEMAATVNPDYEQYSQAKGDIGNTVKTLRDRLNKLEGSITLSPKFENVALYGEEDFEVQDIGKRIYWDYGMNQPIVYIQGIGKDDKPFVGHVPLDRIADINAKLASKGNAAFYDSATARELSRVMYPGQYIGADTNRNSKFSKFAKEQVEKANLSTSDYTVGVQMVGPKDYVLVMIDKRTNTPAYTISDPDKTFKSIADIARLIDTPNK